MGTGAVFSASPYPAEVVRQADRPDREHEGDSASAEAAHTGSAPAWRSIRVAIPAERNARSAISWLG
jgi:hypothetical protein